LHRDHDGLDDDLLSAVALVFPTLPANTSNSRLPKIPSITPVNVKNINAVDPDRPKLELIGDVNTIPRAPPAMLPITRFRIFLSSYSIIGSGARKCDKALFLEYDRAVLDPGLIPFSTPASRGLCG
jgi:hypothetical protein